MEARTEDKAQEGSTKAMMNSTNKKKEAAQEPIRVPNREVNLEIETMIKSLTKMGGKT